MAAESRSLAQGVSGAWQVIRTFAPTRVLDANVKDG